MICHFFGLSLVHVANWKLTTVAHRTLNYLPVSHGSTPGSVPHCSALRTGNQARRSKERVPTPAGVSKSGVFDGIRVNLSQFPRILKDLELISTVFVGIESPFYSTPASPYIALQAMSLVAPQVPYNP